MTFPLLLLHIIALSLTILIEISVALLSGYRDRKALKTVLIAQILTNPIVVLISNACVLYTNLPYLAFQLPLEIAAVCAEWQIYKRFAATITHPFLFSLAANTISYTIGYVLSRLGAFKVLWSFLF